MGLDAIITSYLIGEGIRYTDNGNYIEQFENLDDIFNQEKGTIKEISYEIMESLYNSGMVMDVNINDEEIDIIFQLQFCPNVKIEGK